MVTENLWSDWERNFAANVAYLREKSGMTQTDLARKLQQYGLKFHQQTVQRVEARERPVRLDEANLIARVFDVDLQSLTSSLKSNDQDLRLTIDRNRRAVSRVYENVSEELFEFLGLFEEQVAGLMDRDFKEGKVLTHVEVWALEWCLRTREVVAHLIDTRAEAAGYLGYPEEEQVLANEAFDLAESWMELFWDQLAPVRDLTADDLAKWVDLDG